MHVGERQGEKHNLHLQFSLTAPCMQNWAGRTQTFVRCLHDGFHMRAQKAFSTRHGQQWPIVLTNANWPYPIPSTQFSANVALF